MTWPEVQVLNHIKDRFGKPGETCACTGPVFIGGDLKCLIGRVRVPNHVCKAIYVPRREQVGVGPAMMVIGIAEMYGDRAAETPIGRAFGPMRDGLFFRR